MVLALHELGAPHVPDLLTLLSPGQLVGFFGPVARPVAELCLQAESPLTRCSGLFLQCRGLAVVWGL